MFKKSLALIFISLAVTGCGGGGDSTDSAPIVTNDIVSGKIIFRDENSNEIAVPADAWIRILPTTYYDNGNYTGLNCKISDDGQIGNECYIHENETELRNLINENSETFEVVVYPEQTGDKQWNASENPPYGQSSNVSYGSWENIFIIPTGMFFSDPNP